MKNRDDISRQLGPDFPTTFQEPVFGWLGTHDPAISPIIGVCTLSVRVGDPRNPEVDKTLCSPMKMAYLASIIRHNLKVELVRNYRGDFVIKDVDIYQEIANFAGAYPQPNIIVDLEGEGITGILPLDHGGTDADLSETGAATHFLRQASTGAAITVGAIVSADLTAALTTPPAIGGTTPAAGTFTTLTANTALNVATYAQFTEQGSTPGVPGSAAGRLYARDVLGFTRMGFIDANGVIIDISRDRTIEVNNATGSTIAALRVGRVNGASGSTPFQPTVTPAQGNSVANADGVLGVTIASINNGSNGRIMLHGLLSIDTSGFAGVGPVYIDPTTAGVLTLTKPTAPNVARRVGYVLRANASGLILIDPGEIDTDTTYSVFTGATGGADGTTGLVPQPLTGQQNRILTGDGTWKATMDSVVIGGTTPVAGTFTPLTVKAAAATNRDLEWRSGSSLRWIARVNATAEGGSNAGSDFELKGYADDGTTLLFTPFSIVRSTGAVTVTTFNTTGQVIFNDAGADVDFRVEGDTDANLFFVDASADRVGIGTNTPDAKLQIVGDVSVGNNTAAASLLIKPSATGTALIGIGSGRTGNGISEIDFYSDTGAVVDAYLRKSAGTTGLLELSNTAGELKLASASSGDVSFYTAGTLRGLFVSATGALQLQNEIQIGGALNHDGTTVGFFSVTPDTRPTSTEDIKDGLTRLGLLTGGGATPLATDNGFVDVGTAYYKVGAASNAGNDRLWQDSTDKMLAWQTASGLKMLPGGVIWKMVTATSAITATSETSITGGTVWGTLTIPANTCVAGTYMDLELTGLVTASAGRLRFVTKVDGTLYTSHQTSDITSGAARNFRYKETIKILDTSGTNNMILMGDYTSQNGGSGVVNGAVGTNNWSVGSSHTITIFVFWDTSPSGQSVTVHSGSLKIY